MSDHAVFSFLFCMTEMSMQANDTLEAEKEHTESASIHVNSQCGCMRGLKRPYNMLQTEL